VLPSFRASAEVPEAERRESKHRAAERRAAPKAVRCGKS